jgi:hypothetical protein
LRNSGTFGGGNLQYFGVNSNTAADGFIKCIMERDIKKIEGPQSPVKGMSTKVANKKSSENKVGDIMNTMMN